MTHKWFLVFFSLTSNLSGSISVLGMLLWSLEHWILHHYFSSLSRSSSVLAVLLTPVKPDMRWHVSDFLFFLLPLTNVSMSSSLWFHKWFLGFLYQWNLTLDIFFHWQVCSLDDFCFLDQWNLSVKKKSPNSTDPRNVTSTEEDLDKLANIKEKTRNLWHVI